jgi:adenylate kinase family enzyme
MKSITNTHGRSCLVDNDRSSSDVDGSGQSSSETWRQKESIGSAQQCAEICHGSERDCVWDEIEYLLDSLGRIKAMLTNGTDWDPDEIKWINERYRLCKNQALNYILCLNISRVLETVSFPGEHLSYLEVVKRVVIDCTERELAQALREMGINPCQRVYYRASADLVSVEQAEKVLLELLKICDYVLVSEFLKKLAVPAKSATYTALKKELGNKGWIWKSKKVDGKVVKAICR